MTENPPILQMLAGRAESEWFSHPPAGHQAVSALEHQLQVSFPDDYRRLLVYSDGGSANGTRTAINLAGIEEVLLQSTDPWYQTNLPGMVIVGDDGAGNVYFFDPHNRMGRGPDSLFLVPMSSIGLERAVEVAPNLTEAIQRIYSGVDFIKMLYPSSNFDD